MEAFVRGLPKAELHLHIEGTLEPEMMIDIGRRNDVPLPYPDAAAARKAYAFDNLQSFLDIYYRATSVLRREQDFYDLTAAYLEKAASQNVRHAEIFFDPQTHTARGITFDTIIRGITAALSDGERRLGISTRLIMCILRDLSLHNGLETMEQALDYRDVIAGIGLDSAELGNPPAKFAELYDRAHRAGFLTVAHAGEEGHADYIRQALDSLHVRRIDHGVRCLEDDELVAELVRRDIPLTVCPLSNVRLRVFASMREHPLKRMLDRGLRVTVNSDDPAYFGGYVNGNYLAAAEALGLGRGDIVTLARNSFVAAFLSPAERRHYLDEVDAFAVLHHG
ncbi:MAG: adenosine deaminase [Deltaproteobacteria bacterium]|nr:adenosine deaminase [Candidatus Anaeroferrophillacea bacterium]